VTALVPQPVVRRPRSRYGSRTGSRLSYLLRTTDHKTIGLMYLTTSFTWFLLGGLMAMLMRGELAQPELQYVSAEQYNQLFTMHGTVMLLLFATPLFFAFGNLIVPLQIGAPDVAFPRLNALSYWLFLFGSLIVLLGFLTPGGAPDFGWTAYPPLSLEVHSPGVSGDLWISGLAVSGVGTILGAVNFITTIVCLRAPGMTMFRMPIFTWNTLVTSLLVLLAFPILTRAYVADRAVPAALDERRVSGVRPRPPAATSPPVRSRGPAPMHGLRPWGHRARQALTLRGTVGATESTRFGGHREPVNLGRGGVLMGRPRTFAPIAGGGREAGPSDR
jgi:hypothetical protein